MDLPEAGAVLVIGYGNELRRDDGVGPWVARELAALGLPKVRVRTLHQLVPELAAELAEAGLVVFIDARVGPCRERVTMDRLVPSGTPEVFAHWADPGALLTLATVYEQAPAAVLVSVAGQDFGFGEGLSDFAAANAGRALRLILDLIRLAHGPHGVLEPGGFDDLLKQLRVEGFLRSDAIQVQVGEIQPGRQFVMRDDFLHDLQNFLFLHDAPRLVLGKHPPSTV